MGKYAWFILLAGALFLSAGCSKREAAETAISGRGGETAADISAGFAYPLRLGMWLYTIGDDTKSPEDITRALEAVPLGERLQLISPEPRRATNTYDRKVYDYYQVRRETGVEGLVFATQVTIGSRLAVVTGEKANLYRSARNVDVSDFVLPRGIVVGVFPETETDGFVRVEAYDPAAQVYRRNLFIKNTSISYADTDVQASILLQTARALEPDKEKNRREALLNSALEDYPNSVFADDIRALVRANSQVPVQDTDVRLVATGDAVNVHEEPDAASAIVVQLERGADVWAAGETVDQFTVEGQTNRWYHVTEPVDGWVFGYWLLDPEK
jgi:hypothetical protein